MFLLHTRQLLPFLFSSSWQVWKSERRKFEDLNGVPRFLCKHILSYSNDTTACKHLEEMQKHQLPQYVADITLQMWVFANSQLPEGSDLRRLRWGKPTRRDGWDWSSQPLSRLFVALRDFSQLESNRQKEGCTDQPLILRPFTKLGVMTLSKCLHLVISGEE